MDIGAAAPANLGTLEFQNATRKDRPNFGEGTLIYCRVLSAEKFGRVQLSCINPLDKKAWNSGEAFFQQLKGGLVQEFPIAFCRLHLLQKEEYLLEKLGAKINFELCIGFNGRVWVSAEKAAHTIFVMGALQRVAEVMMRQFASGDFSGYENAELKQEADQIIASLKKK